LTLANWNPDNYEFDFEPVYYEGEMIHAPLIFKADKVFKYLITIVFPDAEKAFRGGGEISCLLMTFSIVEYITGYHSGKQSSEKTFLSFIASYYPNEYQCISKTLYRMRSSLVHNLVYLNPWNPTGEDLLLEENSINHLKVIEGKRIFSITYFLEDTRRATIIYFHDLIMKTKDYPDLVTNFETRFNKKGGASAVMEKTMS